MGAKQSSPDATNITHSISGPYNPPQISAIESTEGGKVKRRSTKKKSVPKKKPATKKKTSTKKKSKK